MVATNSKMGTTSASEGKTPITMHPAFPAVVALWFAALLGLGSMVVPTSVLERIVGITGLSAIIPGAQPPLGFTARGLIALAATVAGAAAGLLLARRMAALHQGLQSSGRLARLSSAHSPRPINAHEELGEEGLLPPPTRRRALSMSEQWRPARFEPDEMNDEGEDEAETTIIVQDGSTPVFAKATETALEEEEQNSPFDLLEEMPETSAIGDTGDVAVTTASYSSEWSDDLPGGKGDDEVETMTDKSEFSSTSLFAQFAREGSILHGSSASAKEAYLPEAEHELDQATEAKEPSLPDLLQRLSQSMDRRRQSASAAPSATPTAPAFDQEASETGQDTAAGRVITPEALTEPARPEEAAQAIAAYFGKPAAIAPLRTAQSPLPSVFTRQYDPQGEEDDAADDLTASLSLPRISTEMPPQDRDEEAEEEYESYPSLLSVGSHALPRQVFMQPDSDEDEAFLAADMPSRQESQPALAPKSPVDGAVPTRMFDKPVGNSAGPGRRIGAETDDALRSVLAKLQRMNSWK